MVPSPSSSGVGWLAAWPAGWPVASSAVWPGLAYVPCLELGSRGVPRLPGVLPSAATKLQIWPGVWPYHWRTRHRVCSDLLSCGMSGAGVLQKGVRGEAGSFLLL